MSSLKTQQKEKRCKKCHKKIMAGETFWDTYPPQEYEHMECFSKGLDLSLKLLTILNDHYIRIFVNPQEIIIVKWDYPDKTTVLFLMVGGVRGFSSQEVTEDWLIDYVIEHKLMELKYR